MVKMRGVSVVIAIILIMMIVVTLAVMAYTWFTGFYVKIETKNVIREVDELNLNPCLGIIHTDEVLKGNEGYIVYCNQTHCVWFPLDYCYVYHRIPDKKICTHVFYINGEYQGALTGLDCSDLYDDCLNTYESCEWDFETGSCICYEQEGSEVYTGRGKYPILIDGKEMTVKEVNEMRKEHNKRIVSTIRTGGSPAPIQTPEDIRIIKHFLCR